MNLCYNNDIFRILLWKNTELLRICVSHTFSDPTTDDQLYVPSDSFLENSFPN